MPGLYRDEGVVLKTIKLGEADRIVTLYTRDNGKVRAVAKGVRKTKSRFGGRLEPFTHVNLLLYRGRGELDTITSVDIVEAFVEMRHDLNGLAGASALAEAIDKITPDRESALSTYALLLAGLKALASDAHGTVVPAFLVKLLSIAGYHPQLGACAGCGSPGPLGGFSPSLGGAVCELCWHEDPHAFGVTPEAIALMAELLAADLGHAARDPWVREVTQALRRYAEHHLERPLRSLQLFAV